VKVKRTRITPYDVGNFAAILKGWSHCETSFFLKQFWISFGMTEMQFYKRLWRAKSEIDGFDFEEIKKNLKRNRFMRDRKGYKSYGAKKATIVNFEGEESTRQEAKQDEKEAGGE